MSDPQTTIAPSICPWECHGTPIDPIWERIPPRVNILIGYKCGTCSKTWPVPIR